MPAPTPTLPRGHGGGRDPRSGRVGADKAAAVPQKAVWLASLAVYREPRLIAVLLMGFSSGLPLALTFATLSFRLAEQGVSRTAIGLFALVGVPYSVKFLWSPRDRPAADPAVYLRPWGGGAAGPWRSSRPWPLRFWGSVSPIRERHRG